MLVDNQYTEVKRSLVLAGGGMRVAYQAGVLLALEESGIKFSHVDGTSGGIFNTAMIASGLEAKEIAKKWRSLKIKHFVSGRRFKDYLKPFFMTGYADADNIRHKIFPHLGIDTDKIQKNVRVNATFNLCNFSNKTIECINNKAIKEEHLLAGVSLPILMPALRIGEDWYIDAVWIKDANLLEGVRQQSQELWLVWAIGNSRSYLPGAFNQYVHMIEMSANGALLEEFQQINLINQAVVHKTGDYEQKEPVKIFVIKSPEPLPLDPDLFFNKINTRELINIGYENAKARLTQVPLKDSPLDLTATMSNEPGSVLSFRATFTGKLKWESWDSEFSYYLYFRFKELGEELKLNAVSSICIATLKGEIPVFDHRIKKITHQGDILWEIQGKLMIKGDECPIKSMIKLPSPIEMLLGIGFKQLFLTIGKGQNNIQAPAVQGRLLQSVSNRLSACFFTMVKTEKGKAGGIIKRFQMIQKLLEHEI